MVNVKKPDTSLTGRPLFNFSGEISDFDNLRKRVFFSKSSPKDLNSLKTVDRSPVAHQSHQISARSKEKSDQSDIRTSDPDTLSPWVLNRIKMVLNHTKY